MLWQNPKSSSGKTRVRIPPAPFHASAVSTASTRPSVRPMRVRLCRGYLERPWCQRQHARLPTSRGRFESDRMLHTRPKCFRWHTTLPGWKGGFESRRSLTASSFIGEDTALSRQKDGFDSRRGRLASPGIQSTVPQRAGDIRWWCSWEHVALIRRRGLVRLQGSVLATGETGSHLSYKQEFRVRLPGCLRGRGCNGNLPRLHRVRSQFESGRLHRASLV